MRPGTGVEVRSTFDGSWVDGFEVVEVVEAPEGEGDGGNDEKATGYRLRRLSDGEVLPTVFPEASVRRAPRRETWWL